MMWLLHRLRGRRLGFLADSIRADAWCLALNSDTPVPFWPADHPSALEGVVIDSDTD